MQQRLGLRHKMRMSMRSARKQLKKSERVEAEKALVLALKEISCYKVANNIALYYPLTEELSTHMLMDDIWQQEKKLWLPCCNGLGHIENFMRHTRSTQLLPGYQGIMQPASSKDTSLHTNLAEIDLIVVPCVALDVQGFRLGFGNGGYDRLLALKQENTTVVYVAYQVNQVADTYPAAHDQPSSYQIWV